MIYEIRPAREAGIKFVRAQRDNSEIVTLLPMLALSRVAAFGFAVFATATPSFAQAHFTACLDRTGIDATVIIPDHIQPAIGGQPIAAGDEIAAFTSSGTCAGAITWTGDNLALTVRGQSDFSKLGYAVGEQLQFRVWDASAKQELGSVSVVYAGTFRSDGEYGADSIFELQSLNASAGTLTDTDQEVPAASFLDQNHPNPVVSTTVIEYGVAHPADVRLDVYDALGRRVAVLVDATQGAGRYQVAFQAMDLANGIYFYRLHADDYVEVRTMVVTR